MCVQCLFTLWACCSRRLAQPTNVQNNALGSECVVVLHRINQSEIPSKWRSDQSLMHNFAAIAIINAFKTPNCQEILALKGYHDKQQHHFCHNFILHALYTQMCTTYHPQKRLRHRTDRRRSRYPRPMEVVHCSSILHIKCSILSY